MNEVCVKTGRRGLFDEFDYYSRPQKLKFIKDESRIIPQAPLRRLLHRPTWQTTLHAMQVSAET